jgi:drug/metabolite transporter (DMT)-like permease
VGEGLGYGPTSFGPDLGAVAVLSIGAGLGYLLVSRRLDQRGRHGIATPVLVAAIPALLQGALAFVIELESVRAAVIVAAVGLLLAVHDATVHRRATTWLGAAVVVAGLGATLADLADGVEVAGVLLALAGVAVVAGAQLLVDRLGEPDEMALPAAVPPSTTP